MAQVTLRDYLQETEDAIGNHQTEKALANCKLILAQFPDSLEGQRLLGEIHLAQGHLEDAQHSFDWVLSSDPEHVIAYCSRALVSERLSDFDTALDCYQQAYELSRGNSRIRHAFNQLSTRVGQQGFMLSRAGLARLYMRGDLMSQAVQEWEVVLAATPDRLDARTGLLEAYWREGLYDQVSQLGNQILQSVPNCLKALILLAHVTAPQDMLRSQELMKRAEALDPDLTMAHDLFADQLASQSRDPFLKLLKRPAALIADAIDEVGSAQSSGAALQAATVQIDGATSAALFAAPSDALATWGNMEGWSNDTTLIRPRSDEADQQAIPSPSTWNEQSSTENHSTPAEMLQNSQNGIPGASWSIDEPYRVPWDMLQSEPQAASTPEVTEQPEPWQLLQNTLNSIHPEVTWTQPRAEQPVRNDVTSPIWPMQETHSPSEEANAQIPIAEDRSLSADFGLFPPLEENDQAAPAWLSMLTEDERNQLSGVMPVVKPDELRSPSPSNATQIPAEPVHNDDSDWVQPAGAYGRADDTDEEGMLFGPDWLKSLGAASLEDEHAEESTPSRPSAQVSSEMPQLSQPPVEAQDAWYTQVEQPQAGHEAEHQIWSMPQYETSIQQEQPEHYMHGQPEELAERQTYHTAPAQPEQEPTSTRSWLDALSSSPQFDHYQATYQPAEENKVAEPQPQFEHESEQPAAEAWSSYWHETEQAQPSWLSQMAEPQTPAAEERPQPQPVEPQPQLRAEADAEQNVVTTLEELEQKLRSQGFVHLEPNALSSIAQTQNASPAPEEPTHMASYDPHEQRQEPSLSSALAELGNFIQPAASSEKPAPAVSAASEQQAIEPSWLASLRPVPAPVEPEIAAPQSTAAQEEKPAAEEVAVPQQQEVEPTYAVSNPVPEPASASLAQRDLPLSPIFEATPPSALPKQPDAVQVAAARMNPLLDNELETTMKRPAVRLQPMQKRSLPSREQPAQQKSRASEPRPVSDISASAGYRERLLRGYQSQLIGDYDGAMQEYRIIIRNTPELLSEVISNLRALLKLAPKYSAGYRVLGDAYMRQGEYLQAMEAYNKALTMAKKAKN